MAALRHYYFPQSHVYKANYHTDYDVGLVAEHTLVALLVEMLMYDLVVGSVLALLVNVNVSIQSNVGRRGQMFCREPNLNHWVDLMCLLTFRPIESGVVISV